MGGQIGTDFDVHIQSGQRTDEVERIVFSHPGIVGECIPDAKLPFSEVSLPRFGHFHISIGKDVPPGLYEARVQGRFGLSNSRTFLVTNESWSSQTQGGSDLASALNLPIDQIVQDECAPRQRKFYRLNLQAKQGVQIRLLTSSLDSRARLLVTLMDTLQKNVASSVVLENQDSILNYYPTQSGIHTLIVSDHLFRGGPEYRYAVIASPLESGVTRDFNMVEEWRAQVVALKANELDSTATLLLKRLSPNTATLRMPTIESQPTIHEEAQFPAKKSCSIEFPSLIVGRFDANADDDWFEFSLDAKTPVAIEVVSDRLGELTDPQLIVYRIENPGAADEKLHQVAIADDIANVAAGDVPLATRDAILQFIAPESGTYRLMIRDQQRSDFRADRHCYAVELRKPVPDLSAVTYFPYPTRDSSQSQQLAPTIIGNGTLAVAVAISRYDGLQGPVEIQVEGLPSTVSSTGLTLAADQTNGHLVLDALPNSIASTNSIAIRVRTTFQDQPITRIATPIEFIWGPIETQKAPVARLATKLMLAVDDRDQMPLKIQLGSSEVVHVERGSKLKIPVAIQRSEGGKQTVIVRLRNAPAKTKANDLTISPDASNGELELNVPNDAPIGEFTCWAQCESKVKFQPNPQSLDRAQKFLAELQSKKEQFAENQLQEIDKAIAVQQEKVKQVQESTKLQEFTVQLPSTATRFRIVEKP